jgi:hypothetical protein
VTGKILGRVDPLSEWHGSRWLHDSRGIELILQGRDPSEA